MMMIKSKFAIILTMLLGSIFAEASSIMDRFNSGEGRPKLRQMKRTSVVEIYTGSHHARALSTKACVSCIIENERVFGRGSLRVGEVILLTSYITKLFPICDIYC